MKDLTVLEEGDVVEVDSDRSPDDSRYNKDTITVGKIIGRASLRDERGAMWHHNWILGKKESSQDLSTKATLRPL